MEPLPPNLTLSSVLPADFRDYPIDDTRTLLALSRAEERHFWHRSRNSLITQQLKRLGAGRRLLELGCGGGAVAKALVAAGFEVTGVDGHLPRLIEASTRCPAARFIAHDLSRGVPPVEPASFDVVGFFDVLEHLDVPEVALDDALGLVTRNGLVVGTVPAMPSLYSRVDELSGHKQRFTRESLTAVFSRTSWRLVDVVSFHRHLVPLMWLQRRLLLRDDDPRLMETNLKVPIVPVNEALTLMGALERQLAPILRHAPIPGPHLWFAARGPA